MSPKAYEFFGGFYKKRAAARRRFKENRKVVRMTQSIENSTQSKNQLAEKAADAALKSDAAAKPKRASRAKTTKSTKSTKSTAAANVAGRGRKSAKESISAKQCDVPQDEAISAGQESQPGVAAASQTSSREQSAQTTSKPLAASEEKKLEEAQNKSAEESLEPHESQESSSAVVIEPAALQTPEALKREELMRQYQERMQRKQKEDYEAFLKERELARLAEKPEDVKKVFRRTSRGNIKAEIRPRAYASEKERLLALISMPECLRLAQEMAGSDEFAPLWDEFAFVRRVSKKDLQKRFEIFIEDVMNAVAKGYFEDDFCQRLKRLEKIEAIEKEFARRASQEGRRLFIDEINEITSKYGEEALARIEILQKLWARGMPAADLDELQASDARVREERRKRHACERGEFEQSALQIASSAQSNEQENDGKSEGKSAAAEDSQDDVIRIADLQKEGRRVLARERAHRRDGLNAALRVLDWCCERAERLGQGSLELFKKVKSTFARLYSSKSSRKRDIENASCGLRQTACGSRIKIKKEAKSTGLPFSLGQGFCFLSLTAAAALMVSVMLSAFDAQERLAVVDERAAREVLLEMAEGETLAASIAASEGFDALFAAAVSRAAIECDCVLLDSRAVLSAGGKQCVDKTDLIKHLVREAARTLAHLGANPAQPDYLVKVQSALEAASFPNAAFDLIDWGSCAAQAAAGFCHWLAEQTIKWASPIASVLNVAADAVKDSFDVIKRWGAHFIESSLEWLFPRFGVHEDSFAVRAQREEQKRLEEIERLNEQRQNIINALIEETPQESLSLKGEKP